ncbi:MAG: hypothetical protein H7096_09280 [Flavobacterium sp.]|nr:hypothetical protein [Pedobacter sp.]
MDQNFQNHFRIVKGYHILLTVLLLSGLVGSIFNLASSIKNENLYSASLIVLLFVIGFFIAVFSRSFALKAQDRAIRAEESFRYYLLTGKTLPLNLNMTQIIALRFAPDNEFQSLSERASVENLNAKEIKSAIKNWKADHHRV